MDAKVTLRGILIDDNSDDVDDVDDQDNSSAQSDCGCSRVSLCVCVSTSPHCDHVLHCEQARHKATPGATKASSHTQTLKSFPVCLVHLSVKTPAEFDKVPDHSSKLLGSLMSTTGGNHNTLEPVQSTDAPFHHVHPQALVSFPLPVLVTSVVEKDSP